MKPATGPAAEPAGPILLSHDLLLGQRLRVHALARFIVAGAIVAGGVLARTALRVEGLDLVGLGLVAAAVAIYNVVLLRLIGDDRCAAQAAARLGARRGLLYASIVLDYLALTATIWLVGGVRSPCIAFYLFHIAIASILLSRRAALVSALLASLMLASLAGVEASGLLRPPAPSGLVPAASPLDARYAAAVLTVSTILFMLTALSQTALAEALRREERATLRKAGELERLSGMRRDFLHVAIHDVGSPIGTVAMLLRNLRDGLCGPLAPAQTEQLERVLRRLARLEALLRDLRLLGELESADLRDRFVPVDLAGLLAEAVGELAESALERRLLVVAENDGRPCSTLGVSRLLREAIDNYLTNAIKYTRPGGRIRASARARPGVVRVEVADSGVGIAPDDRERLFREFVRLAPAGSAGEPEAAGTGLGLSIVRRIVEAHGGRVGVESTLGVGSTFWFEVPAFGGGASAQP